MTGGSRRRRILPRTIRTRITAVAALAVLVVLAAASVVLVTAQRAALVDAVDETLDGHADGIAAQLRSGMPVVAGDLPSEDFLVQVVAADGSVLVSSSGVSGDLLAGVPVPEPGSPVTTELPATGEPSRVLVEEVDGTSVRVAGSLDDARDSTAALAGPLLLAVPLSTAVLAAIVWWAVGRVLRPVEDIRARVDRITGSRLDERVPEPATGDEVARLARTMNAMLGRLQRSAEQQRQFVADAAHELRSPLARIRAELEVDAAHPASADLLTTHDSVLGETVVLQRLVDDLLLLARGDAGALDVARAGPVDLDDVVERLAVARRHHGGRRIGTHGVAPVQVRGDEVQLSRAVGNLLDNAVRHARDEVTVTLGADGDGTAVLTVADDGPGIPPEDRDRVFERFTRLDDARTAGDGGAGLGLAIARDIAERHGGTLTLDPDGPGARFVLSLPPAPDQGNGRISRSGPG